MQVFIRGVYAFHADEGTLVPSVSYVRLWLLWRHQARSDTRAYLKNTRTHVLTVLVFLECRCARPDRAVFSGRADWLRLLMKEERGHPLRMFVILWTA